MFRKILVANRGEIAVRAVRAATGAGITFVGPDHRVLQLAGNKARAIAAAREAGLPTLRSTEPSDDVATLLVRADEIGFPVFVKAVSGGGGRGMRRVESSDALEAAITEAMREAESAFGDPRMYLEEAVIRPRHIEVQILSLIHISEPTRRTPISY